MSIFGVGSMFDSTEEKLPEFKKYNRAFIGYEPTDAPFIHQMMKAMKIGDLIFVKSFSGPHGLYIKAVGIVTSLDIQKDNLTDLGYGIPVEWIWIFDDSKNDPKFTIGKLGDKGDNMRGGTLYEEFNPKVAKIIIDIIKNGTPNKSKEKSF